MKDIINKFYPLVSGVILEEQFQEFFKHATADKLNFLTIMSHNSLKGKLLIRKIWNTSLSLK